MPHAPLTPLRHAPSPAHGSRLPDVRRRVLHFSALGMLGLIVLLGLFEARHAANHGQQAVEQFLTLTQAAKLRWGLAPALVFAGTLIGLMMGMLGMGGGVFKVSCMLIVFKMDIFLARAVSIVTMFFASSTALWQHLKGQPIRWSYATPILLGALPGAFLGSFLGNSLQSNTLTHVFGVFTLFLAFTVLGLIFSDPSEGHLETNFEDAPRPPGRKGCYALGGVHGLISGLLGISGGVVACPAQQMLFNMPLRDAITNTLLASALVTGVSSLIVISTGVGRGDYSLDQVAFISAFMGLGCAIGAPIGARLGKRCPVIVLHLIDFALVFFAGFSILF